MLPAYEEAGRIATAVTRVRDELGPLVTGGPRNGDLGGDGLEIVVVDDGSGDGTAAAARGAGADQVLEMGSNGGKGAAVRAGVRAARGRTVAFTDADLAYSPSQVARLLAEVEDGWDVVVGSRFHHETTTVQAASVLRQLGGRAINAGTRLVLVGDHLDTQCGLKAFRSDVARILFEHTRIDGFAFDVELYLMAERFGLSLNEVPVEIENTDQSTVQVIRDGARMVLDLGRIAWWARSGRYDLGPGEVVGLSPGADAGGR